MVHVVYCSAIGIDPDEVLQKSGIFFYNSLLA